MTAVCMMIIGDIHIEWSVPTVSDDKNGILLTVSVCDTSLVFPVQWAPEQLLPVCAIVNVSHVIVTIIATQLICKKPIEAFLKCPNARHFLYAVCLVNHYAVTDSSSHYTYERSCYHCRIKKCSYKKCTYSSIVLRYV